MDVLLSILVDAMRTSVAIFHELPHPWASAHTRGDGRVDL